MDTLAVLFDLDETLIKERESMERALLKVCGAARTEHGLDPSLLSRVVRRESRALWRSSTLHGYCLAVGISSWEGLTGNFAGGGGELTALRSWVPGYRVRTWTKSLQSLGVDDPALAHQLSAELVVEQGKHHEPYEDAEPALRAVKPGRRLALVTNGAPVVQREKIDRSGLRPWFDSVHISAEVGAGKPDCKIFREALDALEVGSEMAVMVGDSLARDVVGAQRAGIRAIWVNRAGEPPEDGITPDFEIRSLRELPAILP